MKKQLLINNLRISERWKNTAPIWFTFLEWLVISGAILLAYIKTHSIFLKIILAVSYFVFWHYLASLINSLLLRAAWIKNSVLRTIIVVLISFLIASLITDLVIFIVLDIGMGTI